MSEKPSVTDWVLAITSVLSAVAAVAAAKVAWYQAKDAHDALVAQSTVNLSFSINTQQRKRRLGIGIDNAGPGVATIKSVSFFVDNKPTSTTDFPAAIAKLGLDYTREEGLTLVPGDTIAPGATKWVVDYYLTPREDVAQFADLIDKHIRVAVEYCTPLKDCFTRCSEHDECPKQMGSDGRGRPPEGHG